MTSYDFIVGTFNTPSIYTLTFTPPSDSSSKGSLKILKRHDAIGSHSWLALSNSKKNLYATAWTEPPTVAAYSIESADSIKLLNTAPTKSRSGYVCCSDAHVFSAGGATGEVFEIDPKDGSLTSPSPSSTTTTEPNGTNTTKIQPTQLLEFVSDGPQRDDGSTMDFGGLRHGAHSADLSPDNKVVYIADIGRNCVWSYTITTDSSSGVTRLELLEKHISPRAHDGPRHAWPHPNGKILYVLQEHSSMVDVFSISSDPKSKGMLTHIQGVRIIPLSEKCSDYWADEVRLSLSSSSSPQYLYASTRGLTENKNGFVAVYALTSDGLINGATTFSPSSSSSSSSPSADEIKQEADQGGLLAMYRTPTSGGWANAIQPGPTVQGIEYSALTDSQCGYVFVLGWDGQTIKEVARVDLNGDKEQDGDGQQEVIVGAATAVWL